METEAITLIMDRVEVDLVTNSERIQMCVHYTQTWIPNLMLHRHYQFRHQLIIAIAKVSYFHSVLLIIFEHNINFYQHGYLLLVSIWFFIQVMDVIR